MIAFMLAGLAIGEFRLRAKDLRPVLIVILAGNFILRNLMRGNFRLVSIRSIFHAADDPSLERLPFFEQLLCPLRIHVFKDENVLKVSSSHTGALRSAWGRGDSAELFVSKQGFVP